MNVDVVPVNGFLPRSATAETPTRPLQHTLFDWACRFGPRPIDVVLRPATAKSVTAIWPRRTAADHGGKPFLPRHEHGMNTAAHRRATLGLSVTDEVPPFFFSFLWTGVSACGAVSGLAV